MRARPRSDPWPHDWAYVISLDRAWRGKEVDLLELGARASLSFERGKNE